METQDGCRTQTLFATYFVIYLLDKLRNLLAVCCSRWLTFFLLYHMYLMIPYTNLTILHMWLMIETSIIASLLSRKFRQKERIQLNLLSALENSMRQPSFLPITICKEEPYGKAKGTRFRWWISTRVLYYKNQILSIIGSGY